MQFAEPWWLMGAFPAVLGVLLLWWQHDIRQEAALADFASTHLHDELVGSFSVAKRWWRRGLFLASLVCVFLALARPQWGYEWQEVKRHGVEVMFAVDTSKSMLTPDVKPNRLARAKLAVSDFVDKLDGDGVGLIAFAGTAFLECPITLDYDAFNENLDSLDTNTIPRGGTDIARAIRETQAALQQRGTTDKILVLLTDGEDLEGDAKSAAQEAARDGLKIYTVGVGTVNGDLIPVDGGGFLKDENGQFVRSRLDEAGLKAIAEATGGIYASLGTQGEGLDKIYQQAIAPLAKHELAARRVKLYIERYQWPLAASLLFLLVSISLGTRRERPRSKVVSSSKPTQTAVAMILAGVWMGALIPAHASVSSAEEAYKSGDYATAEKEYAQAAEKDPSKSELDYNWGASAYKKGDFGAAAKAFVQSLSAGQKGDAQALIDQQSAYYNLGNTLYRAGEKLQSTDPQSTIKSWEQAIKSYDNALQMRADDADAKFNRDLVQRKLDELKKQQPKDQNKSSDQNSDKNKDSSQNQSSNSQSGGEDQKKNQDQSQSSNQNQNQNQSQNQNSNPSDQKGNNSQANNSSGQDQKPGGASNDASADQKAGSNGSQPNGQNSLPPTEVKPPGSDSGKGATASSASNGKEGDKKSGEPVRVAGQISAEEARNLLDSMKDEERRYPVTPLARTGPANNEDDKPRKDW